MRLVKVILFAALVVGWWQLWSVRDVVTSAYTDERPPLALELDGVSVVLTDADRPVSPYALQSAGLDRAPTFLPIASSSSSSSSSPASDDLTSIAVTGGQVSLSGTVQLLDGTPVSGATIRIERFTSDGQGTAETTSGSDGSWSASGLRGGRLRVRAFAPNQLASVDPSVLIVSRSGSARLTLLVEQPTPGLRFDMVGPPGIAIGTAGTAAVVVSSEQVDQWGRLTQLPVPGLETTASVSGGRLLSADVVVTDAGGAVRYLVACDVDGAVAVVVKAATEEAVLALPSCMSSALLAELEATAAAERAAEEEAAASLVSPGGLR